MTREPERGIARFHHARMPGRAGARPYHARSATLGVRGRDMEYRERSGTTGAQAYRLPIIPVLLPPRRSLHERQSDGAC
jgi:hypothetical protein